MGQQVLKLLREEIARNEGSITDTFLDKVVHRNLRVVLSDPNFQK